MNHDYVQIYDLAVDILQRHPNTRTVLGADFNDVADDVVVINNIVVTSDNGRAELSVTTEDARSAFDWRAELTFDDGEEYKHFLLRNDQVIVETYGKNVIDVDVAGVDVLSQRMSNLYAWLSSNQILSKPGHNAFVA